MIQHVSTLSSDLTCVGSVHLNGDNELKGTSDIDKHMLPIAGSSSTTDKIYTKRTGETLTAG